MASLIVNSDPFADAWGKVNDAIGELITSGSFSGGTLTLIKGNGDSIAITGIGGGGGGTITGAAQGLNVSGSNIKMGGPITEQVNIGLNSTASELFIGGSPTAGNLGSFALDIKGGSFPFLEQSIFNGDFLGKVYSKLQYATGNNSSVTLGYDYDGDPINTITISDDGIIALASLFGITGNVTVDLLTDKDFNVNRVSGDFNQNLSIQGITSSNQDLQWDSVVSVVEDTAKMSFSESGSIVGEVKANVAGVGITGVLTVEGPNTAIQSTQIDLNPGSEGYVNSSAQAATSGDEAYTVFKASDSYGAGTIMQVVNQGDQYQGTIKLDKQGFEVSPVIDLLIEVGGTVETRILMQNGQINMTGGVSVEALSVAGSNIVPSFTIPAISSLTAGSNSSFTRGRVYGFPNTTPITANLDNLSGDMIVIHVKNFWASTHTLSFTKYETNAGVTHIIPTGGGGIYAWLGSTYGWSRLATC